MRKVFGAILLIAAIAGCTSHKVTEANGTTVTTNGTGDNQTVTVQASGGTITAGKNAVDPSKVGLPVYPGATADESGAMAGSNAQGSSALVSLKTADSFDKVYGWYKSHLPANAQTMESTSGGTSVGSFVEGTSSDKEQKSVTITTSSDGTTITLMRATKN
ncbi:MAG TPA: hypothetical protein VEV38_13775 [Candidatus Eremiobacteraceae bacterium]|nr:hypothetical protein [Candidatus Eremiobacteraceae bacterium]